MLVVLQSQVKETTVVVDLPITVAHLTHLLVAVEVAGLAQV
jgi:hypothetical protein